MDLSIGTGQIVDGSPLLGADLMATNSQRIAKLEADVAALQTGKADVHSHPYAATDHAHGTPPTPAPPIPPEPPPIPIPCGDAQARINGAAAGSVLDLSDCAYSGALRIPKALTIRGLTLTLASIELAADGIRLEGYNLTGRGAATYDGFDMAIWTRRSAAAPLRDLVLADGVIRGFGYGGMYLRQTVAPQILRQLIEDVAYAGAMLLSAKGGLLQDVTVRRVGMIPAAALANQWNAYGIALTAGEAPECHDVLVERFLVEDVPTWEALDTHGGQRLTFQDGTVRRSRRGVTFTSSNVNSANKATDCKALRNQFLVPRARVDDDQYALVPLNTIRSVFQQNTITGWGVGHDLLPGYPNTNLVYPLTGPDANTVTP